MYTKDYHADDITDTEKRQSIKYMWEDKNGWIEKINR